MKKKAKTRKNSQMSGGYQENMIFQRNMMALEKRYPQILQLLQEIPVSSGYEIIPLKSGMYNLHVRKFGVDYYHGDDPIADVEQQIAELKLKNVRMAIFLGLGLGYEALYYGANISQQQTTNQVLIVEKDPYIFLAALRSVDISALLTSELCHFVVGVPEEKLFLAMQGYLNVGSRFLLTKAASPIYHISSLKMYKDYYLAVLREFREAARLKVLDYGNCPQDSMMGVENMLENLREITGNPGINMLFNAFRGKPGIVVSSGPSLEKNKHLLKGLEDKAVIVCANSTIRPLLNLGVKPHFVAALERTDDSVPLVSGFTDEQVENVYYAACPVVHKDNYKVYRGPRIVVYRTFDHFKWLGIEKGTLPIKISSGNMAFKLAAAMGCNPIIIIGQDLAFGDDDSTHVEGTDLGSRQDYFYQQQRIAVPGNLGKPVWTDAGFWYTCLKGYEVDVAEYLNEIQGQVINSTEGGAYIKGTVVMPFADAIAQYVQKPIEPLKIIHRHLAQFTSEKSEAEARQVYANILSSMDDLKIMQEYCKNGRNLYDDHHDELLRCTEDTAFFQGYREKIQQLHGEIVLPRQQCIGFRFTWQYLLTHVIQSYSVKFDMELVEIPSYQDDPDMILLETITRYGEWYVVIGSLIGNVYDLLVKAKAQMEESYGFSPDIAEKNVV